MLQNLYETFIHFEAFAQRFDASWLIGTGLTLLAAGLIIWLAGIAFKRIISAIIAGIVAFFTATALTSGDLSSSILACATAIVFGAICCRPVFAITAMALAACFVFVGVSAKTDLGMQMSLPQSTPDSHVLTPDESLQHTRTFGRDLGHNILAIGRKQQYLVYVSAIGIGLVACLTAALFRNVGIAFVCSGIGTLMSLLGMVVLGFYKGARPIELIAENAAIAAAATAGMILFGFVVQLLLVRPRKGKKIGVQTLQKRGEEVEQPRPPAAGISLKPADN